jgi:hypothetical protein
MQVCNVVRLSRILKNDSWLYFVARTWIVSNPEVVAKKAKAKQAKEQAAPAKKLKKVSDAQVAGKRKGKDIIEPDEGSSPKKARKPQENNRKGAIDNDSDNDAEKPGFTISAYIHVLRQNIPSAPPKARSKKPEDEYLQRGPFQFQNTDTYDHFLQLLADTLPCPSPKHIAASKITWKPQKPLKAESLPLGGAVGFSIMINELASKPSRVITLTMPPPAKPVDEVPVR